MTRAIEYIVLGQGQGEGCVHPLLTERLCRAGMQWTTDVGRLECVRSAGLALHWGIDEDCYLEPRQPEGRVRADVQDAIRRAWRARIPILAPCVSVLVVFDSLSGLAADADLHERRGTDGLVLFPAIGTIGSHRPLLGQDEVRVRAWLDAAIVAAGRWCEAGIEHSERPR